MGGVFLWRNASDESKTRSEQSDLDCGCSQYIDLSIASAINPLMARKSSRGFNLRRVRISSTVALAALAPADVVAGAIGGTADMPLRIVSTRLTFSWIDKAAIDGAAEFGLAHGDYTAAEIEECLEATTSMAMGDKIARERANRLVRVLGTITGNQVTAGGEAPANNGNPIKTKLNWLIPSGENISAWIKNSSGVVYTTGSSLSVLGDFWVKPA